MTLLNIEELFNRVPFWMRDVLRVLFLPSNPRSPATIIGGVVTMVAGSTNYIIPTLTENTTVYLPAITDGNTGVEYMVKRTGASVFTLRVVPNLADSSATIDGDVEVYLTTQWVALTFIHDNNNWFIV